jgi:hypothetical protein
MRNTPTLSHSRLVSAILATIAALACAAAVSSPAQAATSTCKAGGVGWSSLPVSATESATMCDSGGTTGSGYCVEPQVHYTIPSWASLFVSVTGVQAGCYHITSYDGAESMWANISLAVTDPLEPWNVVHGTVWLRLAMNSSGTFYKQAGASASLVDVIKLLGSA